MLISSIAPNKVGPTATASSLKPTVVSQSSGTARIGWTAAWDEDNTALTYAVTRDSSTTPIYTTTVNSTFWNLPALAYVDKNLTPGSTHSYRVRVTDPFGNTVQSSATSVTVSSTTVDPYTASVLASGPVAFWPLSDPAGSALGYDRAGGADLTMGAHATLGVAGPHAGSSAAAFQGDPSGSVLLRSACHPRCARVFDQHGGHGLHCNAAVDLQHRGVGEDHVDHWRHDRRRRPLPDWR